MRLNLLSEGVVASELGDVTKLKNALANQLLIALEHLGFRKPNMKPAENPTDDAIVYIEAGQNALTRESQIIMVTIEDDDSVRIQIPSDISRSGKKNLAEILKIDDFFTLMGDVDYVSSPEGKSEKYVLCWFDDSEDDFKKSSRKLTGVTFPSGLSFTTSEEKRTYNAPFQARYGKLC